MSDIDEIRTALSDALRLPGEVHPRPGAATTIRARARSRRRMRVVTFAAAVPVCLGLIALLVGTNNSDVRSVSPPAGKVTATPSASIPASEASIAPGPRTLATPIEIRPVLREYLNCPANSPTVPAYKGPACYRLGPAAVVIRRVRDMSLVLEQIGTGTAGDMVALSMRLTAQGTSALSTLTAASMNKQVAFVVGGKVWTAPRIQGHITEGRVQIEVETGAAAQGLLTELTG